VAAVADCFVLTFRGIAGVSRFPWVAMDCDVTGTVERVERVTQFTALEVRARLRVPAGATRIRRDVYWRRPRRRAWSRTPSRFGRTWTPSWKSMRKGLQPPAAAKGCGLSGSWEGSATLLDVQGEVIW
jgi:hypothetical protein